MIASTIPGRARDQHTFLYCLAGFIASLSGPLVADQGDTYPFSVSNRSGFTMTMDTRWVEANGYRPIVIRIKSSTGSFANDRELTIKITYVPEANLQLLSVTKRIQLSKGAASARTTITVPQRSEWRSLNLEVSENDELWQEFSGDFTLNRQFRRSVWSESATPLLAIDYDAPLMTDLQTVMKEIGVKGKPQPFSGPQKLPYLGGVTAVPGNPPNVEILLQASSEHDRSLRHPEDLPSSWVEYSCFRFVLISLQDLKRLSTDHEEKWRQLSHWIRQGGILLISEVGDEFQGLPVVESVFQMRPLPVANAGVSEDAVADKKLRGWQQDSTVSRWRTKTFVWRKLGFGQIVACRQVDPIRDNSLYRFRDTLIPTTSEWSVHNGFSLIESNPQFFDFLIPGVGLPPVNSFLLLISLFVVVIGPVNYIFLRRAKRLYLMLVTVPVGALIVTVSLFAYALLSDGLGVQVRARSLTMVDQRSDTAACWSRQTYYAALRPSRGLSFPEDATVFMIEPDQPRRGRNTKSAKRRRVYKDGQQVLAAGYLRSRSPSQFMIIRGGETKAEIAVNPRLETNGNRTIRNRLGTRIEMLLVCDAQGRHFWGENISSDDEVIELTPIKLAMARRNLGIVLHENMSGDDAGEIQRRYRSRRRRNRGRRSSSRRRKQVNPKTVRSPQTGMSVLERGLSQIQIPGRQGLQPHSYIAITEQAPEVPYGVPRPRHTDSFHVTIGHW